MTESKSGFLRLVQRTAARPVRRILVVGSGSGAEAGRIARAFEAWTVGISLEPVPALDREGASPAELLTMDARALAFRDQVFDLVYAMHVLEHVPDPSRALAEMARVLRPGGTYAIGTHNRARLVGYLGLPLPFREKLRLNAADWRRRLGGRWSNEEGALAGFTARELGALCEPAFGRAPSDVSRDYYRELYGAAGSALWRIGAGRRLCPSVYCIGVRA
jgi:SAM-dependent methyltransferase